MAQTMQLKNTDTTLRQLVDSVQDQQEACVIQDDQKQPVAVMLSYERYASFQAYLKRRTENFAILDRIADKTKDFDDDFIDGQIEKALTQVKSTSNTGT